MTGCRMDAEVTARLRDDNLPGVALAVAAAGRVVLDACWGVADRTGKAPLTSQHLLRASSLTKLLTAVVALQLAERGRLRLDDPVERYVPRAAAMIDPFGGPPITLRHLLNHRGGLPRGPYRRPEEAVDLLDELPSLCRVHAAGERVKYSNVGYALLARALEVAAGRPFAELVRDGVLAPAGMDGNRLEGSGGTAPLATRPLATGHQRGAYRSLVRPGDRLVPAPPVAVEPGAGGLLSRPGDLVRLLLALAGAGGGGGGGGDPLLSPASWHELQRGEGPLWRGRGAGEEHLLWHDGGGAGFSSLLRLDPRSGLAAVAMANRCSAVPVLRDLLEGALAPWTGGAGVSRGGIPADLAAEDAEWAGQGREMLQAETPHWENPGQETLAPEAGSYAGDGGPLQLTATAGHPAGLLRTPAGDVPLRAHGGGRWIQSHGPWSEHLLRAVTDSGGPWELRAGPHRWLRTDLCAPLHQEGVMPRRAGQRLAGRALHPVLGDVWVHARPEGLTISSWFGEEVPLERTGPRTWRPAGGIFAWEPLEVLRTGDLALGGMRMAAAEIP